MTRPASGMTGRGVCEVLKGGRGEEQRLPNFVDLGHHPVAIRR